MQKLFDMSLSISLPVNISIIKMQLGFFNNITHVWGHDKFIYASNFTNFEYMSYHRLHAQDKKLITD